MKPELFQRMNQEMVACFHEDYADWVRRWRERLVWAVDGTQLNLPDTPETRERYTVQINQHDEAGVVQGMASFLYDVVNEVTINTWSWTRNGARRASKTIAPISAGKPSYSTIGCTRTTR